MSFNLGINVVEVDGRATPSLQAAPTSIAGFVIHARRGIPGQVRRVTNWTQFVEHFGTFTSAAYGAYAVQGFFDNGGVTAYVTRVVNTTPGTASAASVVSSAGPWRLRAGGTLTIESDIAGAPFTATFEAEPAALQGGAGPFDLLTDGEPDTLDFIVNGVDPGAHTFDLNDFPDGLDQATPAQVAAVLNREFRGIQAFVDPDDGTLRVRTDRQGTAARLQAAGTAVAELGFPTGTVSGDGNVSDANAVTVSEAITVIGDAFTGLQVTADAGRVRIRHPEAGAGHTLQFTDGADSVHDRFGFDTDLHGGEDGDAAAAAVAANRAFNAGAEVALTFTAAYRGTDDPGGWGNSLAVRIAENPVDSDRFDVVVRYAGRVVETWERLGMVSSEERFVQDTINDEFSGSKFVRVVATGTSLPDFTDEQPDGGFVSLQDGSDGAFASTPAAVAALAEAVDLFENVDIQLLCCPETDDAELVTKALTHCEQKNDRMFVGHTPRDLDAPDMRDAYSEPFQGSKVFGALYFPWIQVAQAGGGRRWVPPTGHILGMYARTDRERGVWKAPAGNAARLNGALDVRFHLTDTDHTNLVKNASVNAVRFLPGQGIVVDSSRTLSTSTLWLYVNVRLLFNLVKSSLKTGLRWVVQEPNHPDLWNKVKYNSVTPFLMGLWRRGAFGPGAAEDVFTVKVDAENNPPENIQQGILTVEVYFYPSRPAETIIITVGQQEGGGSASES